MHAITLAHSLDILTKETNATRAPRLLAQLCLNEFHSDVSPESARLVQWHLAEVSACVDPSAAIPEARKTPLSAVWQDGKGFQDETFRKFVSEFRLSWVTSPVSHADLAEADEDEGLTWELGPTDRYEVRTVYAVDCHGSDCEMVAIADHVGEHIATLDVPQLAINYGLWDTESEEWVTDFSEVETPDQELQTQYGDTLDVYNDEGEADEAAERLNIQDARENCYGYPWAQYNCYQLQGGTERHSEALTQAGFRVAEHTPSGETYFGIDGGGYCFDVHWVKLALLLAGAQGVPTDSGRRVFVAGYSE